MTLATVNDLPPGTLFNSISLTGSGYTLSGNPITLLGGILGSGDNTAITFDLDLVASQSISGANSSPRMLQGNVNLEGNTLTMSYGFLTISGVISGSGSVNTLGESLTLDGNNTYTGATTGSGTLNINGSQPSSAVTANGLIDGKGTIGPLTTYVVYPGIGLSSNLRLNTGSLLLNGAILFVGLDGNAEGMQYNQLNVTGTVTLIGATLNLSVGFTPAPGDAFRIINNDGTDSVMGTFSGLPEGSVFVVGGHSLRITYKGGTGNDVVLTKVNGTQTWNGANGSLWSTADNWASGIVPVAGDTLIFPSGAMNMANANDIGPSTNFYAMTFLGSGYSLSGNDIRLTGGISALNTSGSNSFGVGVQLVGSQAITVSNAGATLNLSGGVDNNGFGLTVTGAGSTNVSGDVIGAGGLTKSGSGALRLSGLANAYTGPTTVNGGIFGVNGNLTTSVITVNAGATLEGTGTIGVLNVAGGTVSPGASPGILSTGNVSFTSGSTYSVELNGATVGTGYDQLNVAGSVSLGNATLSVTLGFVPTTGQSFTVIANDGADAVSGTFSGLAEEALLTVGGTTFKVSYAGGTGNDVVLTAVVCSPDAAGPAVTAPASVTLTQTVCN